MNRKTSILSAVLVISMLGFAGCFYDKGELIYPSTNQPGAPCDTANMTFAKDILNLVNANCSNCHTGPATSGFNFTNLNALKNRAVSGVLLDRLTTTDPIKHMPQGGTLSTCDLNKFRAWIKRPI